LEKFKLLGCLLIFVLLVGCGRRVEDGNLSNGDLVGGITESDNTSVTDECAHVEGDEEVSIYDRCWRDVWRTPEGRAFEQRYLEEVGRAFPGSLFGSSFTKNPTFGEIKAAFETVLTTCELNEWERRVCDTTAILEVGGVRIASWWQGTERLNNLQEEFTPISRGPFFWLDEDYTDITIDDLERAVRRSLEDGVDYATEAIRNGEFIDPIERN